MADQQRSSALLRLLPVLALALAGAALVGLQPRTPDSIAAGSTVPDDPDRPWTVTAVTRDGAPMRWDPCTPIRWELQEQGAPFEARALVDEALARVATATGLQFEFVGTTTEHPTQDRASTRVVDGERVWSPVLVSWSTRTQSDLLADGAVGTAAPLAVAFRGTEAYTTGQVVFDADRVGQLLSGFRGRTRSWGGVVLHELGHLVGLGHVDDAGQLMSPSTGFGEAAFQSGDLDGLAAVGAGAGCLEAPPATAAP